MGMHGEVAVHAADLHAQASNPIKIRPEQEVDVLPGAAELRAIVAAEGAASDDADLQGIGSHDKRREWKAKEAL